MANWTAIAGLLVAIGVGTAQADDVADFYRGKTITMLIGGSVGAGRRMSFTLLGDTVNLAARLEELNKHHGTSILASRSTRDACGERFAFANLGSVAVRGRSESIEIFSVDPNLQGPNVQGPNAQGHNVQGMSP